MRRLISLGLLLFLGIALVACVTAACLPRTPSLSYASLVKEMEAKNVTHVVLSTDRALVTLAKPPVDNDSSGPREYRVGLRDDANTMTTLIKRLARNNIPYEFAVPKRFGIW